MTGDRRLATHEAAHAVVAIVRGAPVRYVTVRPGDDAAGHASLATGWANTDLTDMAVIALSGPISEKKLMGLTDWPASASDDLAQASKAVRMSLYGTKATFTDSWDDTVMLTEILVARHWDAIQRVADALVRRGRMSGAAVRASMQETR